MQMTAHEQPAVPPALFASLAKNYPVYCPYDTKAQNTTCGIEETAAKQQQHSNLQHEKTTPNMAEPSTASNTTRTRGEQAWQDASPRQGGAAGSPSSDSQGFGWRGCVALTLLSPILLLLVAPCLGLYIALLQRWRSAEDKDQARRYKLSQARHNTFVITQDRLTVRNLRSLTVAAYSHDQVRAGDDDAENGGGEDASSPYHIERSYDLNRLDCVWLLFSPYHCFITFEFLGEDDDEENATTSSYLTWSVEGRYKFEGGGYPNLWQLLTPHLNLYPIFCTEEDAFHRCMAQEEFPYPITIYPLGNVQNAEFMNDFERSLVRRLVLRNCIRRVEEVRRAGEHYGYLTNSCATNTMAVLNQALTAIQPKSKRRRLWGRGLLSYLGHTELGMQRLLYTTRTWEPEALGVSDSATFEEVWGAANITAALRKLTGEGVRGEALSYQLRGKFRAQRTSRIRK